MPTLSKLEDAVTGQAVSFVPGKLGPLQLIPLLGSREGSGSGRVVLQEGEKPSNDVADKMTQLVERWEQRIRQTNRRFNERFLAGEIHILIIFRLVETNEVWFVCLESNSPDNHILSDRQNETVLIGIVESSEQPKCLASTFVRLEPINSLNRFPPRTLYASSLSGFITLKGMEYRELNVFPFFGGSLAPRRPNYNQVESEMIESATQVVDHISRNGGNIGTVDIKGPEFKAWLSSLRIKIDSNHFEGCLA